MNKEAIKTSLKAVLIDRPYVSLIGLVIAAGVIYCLITILSIHPSDVVVYTRYTAFGEVHFYKDHWQYLLNFVFFGFAVALFHSVIMVKLHDMGRRQTGLLIGWFGFTILLITLAYTLAVIGLGHAA